MATPPLELRGFVVRHWHDKNTPDSRQPTTELTRNLFKVLGFEACYPCQMSLPAKLQQQQGN